MASSVRSCVAALPELLDPLVGVVEPAEPGGGGRGPGKHLVDGVAVLAGQRGQGGAALGDHREPVRVGLEPAGVGRDVGREVGQQVGQLGEPVGQLPRLGVVLADARRAGCGPPRSWPARRDGPPRWRAPPGPAPRRCAACRRGPAWPPRTARSASSPGCGERASISSSPNRSRSASRARSRAEVVSSVSSRSLSRRSACTRAYVVARLVEGGAAEAVQGLPLGLRLEQPVLVGLAVHGDERLGHRGQRGDRHRGAAHERARAPLGRDGAGQQHPLVLDLAARVLHGLGHRRRGVHDALDARVAGAGADRAGVGAAAQEQPEGGHEHRLAGAGLAGDHGEPGPELERRGLDHAQPGDPDLLDHAPACSSGRRRRVSRTAPALDRQVELGDQGVRELVRVQPHEGDRGGAAAHLDPRAGRQVHGPPAVAPEHAGALGPGQHLDRELGGRRDHHRSGEQRVGADRHHQQGVHAGPDDRSARREVVGRRPGRRRADHAVAAPARDRTRVDLDDHLEHPLARGLLDAGLVEREGAGHQLAVAVDRHVDGEPVLEGVVAADDRGDHGVEVVVLRLREEADVPEVDPQQRDARGVGDLGGPQDRAVAADHQRQLAVLAGGVIGLGDLECRLEVGRRHAEVGGLVGQQPDPEPVLGQRRARTSGPPPARPRDRCGRPAAPVVAGHPAAARRQVGWLTGPPSHQAPPAARSAPPRAATSAAVTVAGPRRSHTKNSTLPDGPGNGLVVTARAPQPRAAGLLGHPGDRLGPQVGVADHAALPHPLPADLELRLDHQGQVAVVDGHAEQRVEDQQQRDERQVTHHQVDGPADRVRGQLAHVGAVVRPAPAGPGAGTTPAVRSPRPPRPPRGRRAGAARR